MKPLNQFVANRPGNHDNAIRLVNRLLRPNTLNEEVVARGCLWITQPDKIINIDDLEDTGWKVRREHWIGRPEHLYGVPACEQASPHCQPKCSRDSSVLVIDSCRNIPVRP